MSFYMCWIKLLQQYLHQHSHSHEFKDLMLSELSVVAGFVCDKATHGLYTKHIVFIV